MTFFYSLENKVLTIFATAAIVIAGLCATTWKLSEDAVDASVMVAHTHEILNHIAQARASSLQIELSTQNYRITGDPAFIQERDLYIRHREDTFRKLQQLAADSPQQQQRLQQLRLVIDQRLAISNRVQQLRATQGLAAATAYANTAPLKATRERLYRLFHDMAAEESRLLNHRNQLQQYNHRILITVATLVALFVFFVLTSTFVVMRRQLRATEASQRALADSEENLSTTLHSIGDAVLATDTHSCITRMNPVAERLTGWPFADAKGRPISDVFNIIHEETRQPALIPVEEVLTTGKAHALAGDTVLIARDGTEYPISDSASPICDTRGTLRGVVLVFRDTTLERQAQRVLLAQNELLEQHVRERTSQLQESESHLRSVVSNVPALIAYVDANQRYVYVNEQYRARFAPDRDNLTNCTVREILGEQRYAIASPLITNALQGEPQSYDWQPFPDVWQVIHYAPTRGSSGNVTGYYVLGTDITPRKHAEEKIQALNAQLEQHVHDLEHLGKGLKTLSAGNRAMLRATDERNLLDSMCTAIVEAGGYHTAVVWYAQQDKEKTLRAMAVAGYPGDLAGLNALQTTWADNAFGQGAVARAIRTRQTCIARDIVHDPNYAVWENRLYDYASAIACPLTVAGQIIGALAIYSTVPDTFGQDESLLLTESADDLAFGIATLRVKAEQQDHLSSLYRLTHFDTLTGLPNETQFTEIIQVMLDVPHPSFALLQANIEKLSDINDALGFSQGDQMLCEFATRLLHTVPPTATVARLRGDEFAILLPDSSKSSVAHLLHQLESTLSRPFGIEDISFDVSARIGVVICPEHGRSPHDLYRHMDIAVHLAKKTGRKHVIFDPDKSPDNTGRLTIASELRHAIENGDLRLYLQPKVDMRTRQVCGAEALVRWQHAQKGLIPPYEFIGLAEDTGLIKPLTEWVVETAMNLNLAWSKEDKALPIAVNLSAINLRDSKLLDHIYALRTRLGIAPGLFEIELTESTVMEDAEFALQVLHRLKDQGISLYIDDFGTGYSSLSYLQKLPVEYIKIDQSFIRNMGTSKDAELIVRSTIDLVHELGHKVVAEGIETEENWQHLAQLGCDIAQGYLIARPMASGVFQDWLSQYQQSMADS
ncbi:EAL domain-containing protein [Leeia oryzae]|uniref:EAL domain-containing protein n=1 Tax=Leeia oryzae TaxID=356662 RepID=UPI00036A4DAB|nr:EAL domain-containing protein [Leeia oryzae]